MKLPDKVLIDDCYNANPVSMEAAIDLLLQADGRRVAVMGDMFELGEQEKEMHARVGKYAADKGVECIICAGSWHAVSMREPGKQPGKGKTALLRKSSILKTGKAC